MTSCEKCENLFFPCTFGKCLCTGSIILASTTDFNNSDFVKRKDGFFFDLVMTCYRLHFDPQ